MIPAPRPRTTQAALAKAALAIGCALVLTAGCTSSHGSSSPSSSPSTSPTGSPTGGTVGSPANTPAPGSPSAAQLKAALLSASDITIDTFTLNSTAPVSQSGTVGISGIYANASHDRVLSVIVLHYPTTAYSLAGLTQIQTLAAGQLTRNPASDTAASVGQNAHLYQGANSSGPLSILVFAEGKYNVTMEFISKKAGDTVPASVVLALGTKQYAKLKAIS